MEETTQGRIHPRLPAKQKHTVEGVHELGRTCSMLADETEVTDPMCPSQVATIKKGWVKVGGVCGMRA